MVRNNLSLCLISLFLGIYCSKNCCEDDLSASKTPKIHLNLTVDNAFKKPPYYSQYGQDQYVHEHFFQNKQNGFFVDIGAHNGIDFSNSYYFEKNAGWNGICIEPIPSVFEQLKNNRNCICVYGCVTDFEGTATFVEIICDKQNIQMLSGLLDKYDSRHLQRVERDIIAYGGKIKYLEVPCFTPKKIFSEYNINHIDFLSIDTEGGELDILQSIDFARVDIDVITVEVNCRDDKRIYNYLTSHGYEYVTRIRCDELYKKRR